MMIDYDKADPKSIEHYACKLVGKTFLDVIIEKGRDDDETLQTYGNLSRKGGLGNLLEEIYFGYKANSNQEADFPEAGVELKATPYEINKKGEKKAGERLVLTMISYDEPVIIDFYKSHAWEKMRLILLIYYYRNKLLNDNLRYKIDYVRLFTPPETDLLIIREDYQYIISKIESGKAHELSEGDTRYLGACTKGSTADKSLVPQYYGEHTLAKKRAFCFKLSYMTYVLNHYVIGKSDKKESIIKDSRILEEKTFEQVLEDIIEKYKGMTDKELCETFGREYNNNKAQWIDLSYRMLGVRDNHAEEFEKANIVVKSIRIEADGSMKESMSFPPVRFKELVKEEYETSTLHDYFDETSFFFVVWKKAGEVYELCGSQLWHMPYVDLEITVRDGWEKIQHIIEYGVRFYKQIDANGKISFSNTLPGKKDNEIIHIRPHSKKAAYRFLDGFEYGNVERDADELPDGTYMTKQSFWINNSYIIEQLECLKE